MIVIEPDLKTPATIFGDNSKGTDDIGVGMLHSWPINKNLDEFRSTSSGRRDAVTTDAIGGCKVHALREISALFVAWYSCVDLLPLVHFIFYHAALGKEDVADTESSRGELRVFTVTRRHGSATGGQSTPDLEDILLSCPLKRCSGAPLAYFEDGYHVLYWRLVRRTASVPCEGAGVVVAGDDNFICLTNW